MAKLIYSAIASLDGYIEDEQGRFDWAEPDREVHAFVNDLDRSIGVSLYGRRMYETLMVWETMGTVPDPVSRDFAQIWQASEKIVYSRTLETVSTARTRLQRAFDPEAITRLKKTSGSDISIGGAQLAAQAIEAGLVDECHLILAPTIVGGGKRALPNVRIQFGLIGERRFRNGFVHLHYRMGV